MEITEQVRVAEEMLTRLLEWVNRFDNKSAIVLGTEAAMLGLLSGLAPPFRLWTQVSTAFAALTVGSISCSLILVSWGSYPQTKGPDSLLYFGTAAKRSQEEYARSFRNQTLDQYLEDLLAQCHRISEIVNSKFRRLRWAYGTLVFAFLPWIVTLLIFRSLQ
jgi:hypothetical protein